MVTLGCGPPAPTEGARFGISSDLGSIKGAKFGQRHGAYSSHKLTAQGMHAIGTQSLWNARYRTIESSRNITTARSKMESSASTARAKMESSRSMATVQAKMDEANELLALRSLGIRTAIAASERARVKYAADKARNCPGYSGPSSTSEPISALQPAAPRRRENFIPSGPQTNTHTKPGAGRSGSQAAQAPPPPPPQRRRVVTCDGDVCRVEYV